MTPAARTVGPIQSTLVGAPLARMTDPALLEAVRRGEATARRFLALPAVSIQWCSRPGGVVGETHQYADGRTTEIWLNAAANLSPREVWETVLHECKHASDGARLCAEFPREAEDRAVAFPAFVKRETTEWEQLDARRPVAGKGHTPMYEDTRSYRPQAAVLPPHAARRRALLSEGEQLASRAERAGRGFTAGEQRRAAAILAELDGLGRPPVSNRQHANALPAPVPAAGSFSLGRQRCLVCGVLAPKWDRCQCGALGWGHRCSAS